MNNTMKTKKPQNEETAQKLCETTVDYQPQMSSPRLYNIPPNELEAVLRAKEQLSRGEHFTQEEMDKFVSEWLD